MEMRITISSLGLSIGKSGFGASAISGSYIEIRPSNIASYCTTTYGIVKGPSLGSSSGTIVWGQVQTDWFQISNDHYSLLSSRDALVGKTGDIQLIGTLAVGGNVDIELRIFDNEGNVTFSLDKVNTPSKGVQAASTKVRGTIRHIPRGICEDV